jgi:hypothetical protein
MPTFSILTFLMIGITLTVIALVVWLPLQSRTYRKQQWKSDVNSGSEDPQPQSNALVPAMLNLVVTQMMQSQQDHHEQDLEHFWIAQETINDTPAVPDSTWDM